MTHILCQEPAISLHDDTHMVAAVLWWGWGSGFIVFAQDRYIGIRFKRSQVYAVPANKVLYRLYDNNDYYTISFYMTSSIV